MSVTALREHRDRQNEERSKAGEAWSDLGLVFSTTKGSVIEPRNLNRLFDQQIAAAGLRRIRFHDLRHNVRDIAARSGLSPRVVMEMLGHTQLSMTTDLYGHVLPTALRSAADAMDGVLGA